MSHTIVFRQKQLMAILFLCVALLNPSFAVAKKVISFSASLDKNVVYLGQGVQLNLKFEGSSDIPAPELPEIDGFQSSYLGPSTMMSIVNGRISSSITHIYRLVPLKTGKLKIPGISFEYDGRTYKSNPLTVDVLDSAQRGSVRPKRRPGRSVDLNDRVFLVIDTQKTDVYVNEIIPVSIKLYIKNINIRDIQYPEFSRDGFSAEEFSKPLRLQETRDGMIYDVVEFRTKIFATKSGEISIGPATLKANVVTSTRRRHPSSMFDDFFGRDPFEDFFGSFETHPIELKSKAVKFLVKPLPEKDMPEEFRGAVGDFRMSLTVSPAQVKVGDPVTVKTVISGDGNFNTVTAPVINVTNAFRKYEPQVSEDNGKKIFEHVLIPQKENIKSIPDVVFSFFNPLTGKYQRLVKTDIPLKVLKPEKREKVSIVEGGRSEHKPETREELGRDLIYIKEKPGRLIKRGNRLYKNPLYLSIHVIPPVIILVVFAVRRRKERLSSDVKYARRIAAPRKARKGLKEAEKHLKNNNKEAFYDSVFRTIRQYLADRFHLPPGGITADVIENHPAFSALDTDIRSKIKGIFTECDMIRYAPSELTASDMGATIERLKDIISILEKGR